MRVVAAAVALAGAALAFAPRPRPKAPTLHAIRPDDLPKTIVPEAIAKAKRAQDVRKKMAELREYQSQGRDYKGDRLDPAAAAPRWICGGMPICIC